MNPTTILFIMIYGFINFMIAIMIYLGDQQQEVKEKSNYYTILYLFGLPLLVYSYVINWRNENGNKQRAI